MSFLTSRQRTEIPNPWGLEIAWFTWILALSLIAAAMLIGLLAALDPAGQHVGVPRLQWMGVLLVGVGMSVWTGCYWFRSVVRHGDVLRHLSRHGFACSRARRQIRAHRGESTVIVDMPHPWLSFSPTPSWGVRHENGEQRLVKVHGFHPAYMQTHGQVRVLRAAGEEMIAGELGEHARAALTHFFQAHPDIGRALFESANREVSVEESVTVKADQVEVRLCMGPWLGRSFLFTLDAMLRSVTGSRE